MPLREGSSQETVSGNIREMMRSETFGKGKSATKRQAMAAAAAYRKARESGAKLPRKSGKKRALSQASMR